MDAALTLDPPPVLHALTLVDEDVSPDAAAVASARAPLRLHTISHELRYRGLSLDTTTGVVRWHGERIALGASERALLEVLLTHAGRILSVKQLAALLNDVHATERAIEARMLALRGALEHAGSRCLPHKADGVGYILWA